MKKNGEVWIEYWRDYQGEHYYYVREMTKNGEITLIGPTSLMEAERCLDNEKERRS